MGASKEQLSASHREERDVLCLMLHKGVISSFDHCHGTDRDWRSHIDAVVSFTDGEVLAVDLKKLNGYGFILEHENRSKFCSGSAHGDQDGFLIHSLDNLRCVYVSRVDVLELGLSKGTPPDRFSMDRVDDSVRYQEPWAYTGNRFTNCHATGGKKRCFDVVQKIPYRSLRDLPSWRSYDLR